MIYQHLLPRGLCVWGTRESPATLQTGQVAQMELSSLELNSLSYLGNSHPGSQSSKDREVSLQGAQSGMGRAKLHPAKCVSQN